MTPSTETGDLLRCRFDGRCSRAASNPDLGVSIGYLEEEKQGVVADARNGYRLGDVAEAFDHSREFVDAIRLLSEEHAA
jgi:hypothetical protein